MDPFHFPPYLEEGARAKVLCTITRGDPPLSISWLKDGQPLTPRGHLSLTPLDDFSLALAFGKVSLKDRGNYTCVATNAVATVNYSSIAVVHGIFYLLFIFRIFIYNEYEIFDII